MPITKLIKQGAFDSDLEAAINANFSDCVLLDKTGNQSIVGSLVNSAAFFQTYAGATDAIFPGGFTAFTIAIFTSTGPDAATLATPTANDTGKILILVNTNTTQNAVSTAANKIVDGSGTTYTTLTAPVHAGAVAILVAANLLWNVVSLGVGPWVLS